jgi:hypothetical protein
MGFHRHAGLAILLTAAACTCATARAQGDGPGFLRDNSFLIEEAYNQEEGVVQHVATGLLFPSPELDLSAGFTQEWPLFSADHQFSYTIPYISSRTWDAGGIGDVQLNYRYQLIRPEGPFALAPRVTVHLPTGSTTRGFGLGVVGYQVAVPASFEPGGPVALHANAGVTLWPGVQRERLSGGATKRDLVWYNLGASGVLNLVRNLDFLVEWTGNFISEAGEDGEEQRTDLHILNPGFRAAFGAGAAQVVVGLAVPFLFDEEATRAGIFLYFCVEHPF